jgi:hypothetical protein
MTEQNMFSRLEDFISIARKGENVELSIVLDKRLFTRKFDTHTVGDPGDEIDMYILSADYFFIVEGKTHQVTKVYQLGIEGEFADTTRRNINVANERLKMDYKRLREANIVFEEKFWD